MAQCRVLRSEKKHVIKHVIDFFVIEQMQSGTHSFRQKHHTTKFNETAKYKQLEGEWLTNLAREKPRGFWEVIKKQYKQKSPWSNTLTVEVICTHFSDVYGSTPDHDNPEPEVHNIFDEYLDVQFSDSELGDAIFFSNL